MFHLANGGGGNETSGRKLYIKSDKFEGQEYKKSECMKTSINDFKYVETNPSNHK